MNDASNRPFPLRDDWIAASPFRNKTSVRDAERKWKRGEPIGFTARSSLRSMGRIPRVDGAYRVGAKYLAIL